MLRLKCAIRFPVSMDTSIARGNGHHSSYPAKRGASQRTRYVTTRSRTRKAATAVRGRFKCAKTSLSTVSLSNEFTERSNHCQSDAKKNSVYAPASQPQCRQNMKLDEEEPFTTSGTFVIDNNNNLPEIYSLILDSFVLCM